VLDGTQLPLKVPISRYLKKPKPKPTSVLKKNEKYRKTEETTKKTKIRFSFADDDI